MCYITAIDTEISIMPRINKSAYLTVRVSDKTRARFHAKVKKLGTPSDVLRELIDAFIENRVIIQPPVKSKGLFNHE